MFFFFFTVLVVCCPYTPLHVPTLYLRATIHATRLIYTMATLQMNIFQPLVMVKEKKHFFF